MHVNVDTSTVYSYPVPFSLNTKKYLRKASAGKPDFFKFVTLIHVVAVAAVEVQLPVVVYPVFSRLFGVIETDCISVLVMTGRLYLAGI